MCTLRSDKRLQDNGFSTIELLIAFSIGIIFLTAAMMVAFSDPTLAKQISIDSGQAAALDSTLDNTALATSSNKFGQIIEQVNNNWNMMIGGDSDTLYTNIPTIVDISPCLKEITNATTWSTLGNRARAMTFGSAISNMDIAKALGSSGCNPIPPGTWDNPDTLGNFNPTEIDSAYAGIVATAVATKSIGGSLYAFVTSQHTDSTVPDFWIIDVSDPKQPSHQSSLDLSINPPWGGSHIEGANDLVVIGDYAYVLRNYHSNQLQVIDISDLENLTPITPAISFELRGVSRAGTDPEGEVIRYYDGKLYIGLHNTIGPEFLVYDIETNPATPTFIGAIASGFNHSIHDIAINGGYAYLAIKPGATAQNTKELMVINISGATPIDTGLGYNANNAVNDTAGGSALYVLGNRLYLGRERTIEPRKDFYIFDITNPSTPTFISSNNLGQLSGSMIKGIHVSRNLAFLGTTKNPEFRILDISDPLTVGPLGCGGLDIPHGISGISYANNLIFLAKQGDEFFRVIHDETTNETCN